MKIKYLLNKETFFSCSLRGRLRFRQV